MPEKTTLRLKPGLSRHFSAAAWADWARGAFDAPGRAPADADRAAAMAAHRERCERCRRAADFWSAVAQGARLGPRDVSAVAVPVLPPHRLDFVLRAFAWEGPHAKAKTPGSLSRATRLPAARSAARPLTSLVAALVMDSWRQPLPAASAAPIASAVCSTVPVRSRWICNGRTPN